MKKSDVHFPPSDWFKSNRKTRRLQLQASLIRFLLGRKPS